MVKLTCSDYEFECSFVTQENEIDDVIREFGEHTEEEHGIEYQKEVLQLFILRKQGQ